LGSAKRNVGHLDAAAGVTGLINAAHALHHEVIPPAIHYESPNPKIALEGSPFFVNTSPLPWAPGPVPRRAGVSSFGVGGTNAHIVLEEAPALTSDVPSLPEQLLILSARSTAALDRAAESLAAHLEGRPEINLGDVAHTLQVGRREFEHRLAVASADVAGAVKALRGGEPARAARGMSRQVEPPVAFLFPGQGAQHRLMGAGLYRNDPGFQADINTCAEILGPHLGLDLRETLYADMTAADADLRETRLAQPALFAVEYALAQWWMRRGVRPKAMIGHSVGEFVAACLAGVFSLEDGLSMVAARGRLMQGLAPGSMLAVRLSEGEVTPLLDGDLSLAAINGPKLCVIAGPLAAIERIERTLEGREVGTRRLATSHAFHSRMVDPVIGPLTDLFAKFPLNSPTLPYISCVSGTWVTATEATDPAYWARHCRETVRFTEGIRRIEDLAEGRILLEAGPGRTLGTLARQGLAHPDAATILTPLANSLDGGDDILAMLHAAGSLWVRGVPLDWTAFHDSPRRRCPLPTYPFERQRFWIEKVPAEKALAADAGHTGSPPTHRDLSDTVMPANSPPLAKPASPACARP
jgi:acyl transferase domain-containing protein